MKKTNTKLSNESLHFWILALMLILMKLPAQDYEFAVIAGLPGIIGSADGSNTTARFDSPTSLAVDAAGNIYVADYFNYTIRKTTPLGTNWVTSTIAGLTNNFGIADGTNSDARFNPPTGIAVDVQGNLYVADYWSHTIRRLTLAGTNWVVTTIAGSAGSSGSDDGTNTNAKFYYPRDVAVDDLGIVYVTDTANSTIRKITPVGTNWVVTTIAGLPLNHGSTDGTNSTARFYRPAGVAPDGSGNLLVTDYDDNTIRRLAPQGTNWVVTTIAGLPGTIGSADGTNSDARFSAPTGIAKGSDGSFFVADYLNSTVRRLAPAGTNWIVTTIGGLAGQPGNTDGTNTVALFRKPQGVAVDLAGNIYVADTANNTIRRGKLLGTSVAPLPVILTVSQDNGMINFTWLAVVGRSYQIQSLTSLSQTNWIELGGVVTATNQTMTTADSIGPDRNRFYRVALLP